MRVSTSQFFQSGLRNMQDAQSQAARTQSEISAGRRVLTPADDPPAAALAQSIDQAAARNRQYQSNMDVAERDLAQEETELASVENVLFRVRELVIQGGDGALSSTERGAIAAELDQQVEALVSIFNARSATGEYLFSGFQGATRPFVQRADGAVEYVGDEGQRFLQINGASDVEVRDNGKRLFVDVPAANNTFVSSASVANAGTGGISIGRIVDQAAYDAIFPDDIFVSFDEPAGPGSFSVYRRDNTTQSLTVLTTATYVPGEAVQVAGVEFTLSGAPASADEFVLESSATQPLTATIQRISALLRSSADTEAGDTERQAAIAETLDNLSQAELHVFGSRAQLGSRMNLIDVVREEQADLELQNAELKSDLVDLDYNEAISRLSFQTFVLEAAQKSYARITSLSLFNFLR